ncbi:MAG: hydroxymethylbilane synthase [Acidimicrobiaceae bacterium]|nr:hydroxymethylbilane synthase [Acidimicrobiaceae bacterium]
MKVGALRLATRGSPLARFQAGLVSALLLAEEPGLAVEIVVVETTGDRQRDLPISSFGEHGIFVAEVEQAVLDGRADVAVHSAKDLPAGAPPEGLVLASVPDRADPRDALCGRALAQLAPGSLVATGSVRRRSQLAGLRPDLRFTDLRGNIATRLERVPDGGAVVVAMAALHRLGLTERASEVLSIEAMLPQVGQGAIALRCRVDDGDTLELLGLIDETRAHRCVLAERAFLAHLGGGCEAPVGAHATVAGDDPGAEIQLEGLVASEDGTTIIRRRGSGSDPVALGTAVARQISLADGGDELLARVHQ